MLQKLTSSLWQTRDPNTSLPRIDWQYIRNISNLKQTLLLWSTIQTNHDRGWTPQYGIKVHTEGGSMPDIHSRWDPAWVNERRERLCFWTLFKVHKWPDKSSLYDKNTEARWMRLVNTSTVYKQKKKMTRTADGKKTGRKGCGEPKQIWAMELSLRTMCTASQSNKKRRR